MPRRLWLLRGAGRQTPQADLAGTEMYRVVVSALTLPGAQRNDVLLITDSEIQAIGI